VRTWRCRASSRITVRAGWVEDSTPGSVRQVPTSSSRSSARFATR
jgi:hypothetical protein